MQGSVKSTACRSTCHHTFNKGKNMTNETFWQLMQKKEGESLFSLQSLISHLFLVLSSLFFSPSSPPPRQILPYLPSFLLFLSPLWSICDPDIHHRRLTSCVWASSVPHLLLFIPCCVLAVWTVYKHTIAATCTLCVLVHKANVCLWLCMCVCSCRRGHPAGGRSSITRSDSGNLWR